MKKILIFIAAFASCSLAAWNGQVSETAPAVIETVEGSEYEAFANLIYEISTPEELAWFADQVNNQDNAEIVGVLKNDIVFGEDTSLVSEYPWVPIGRDNTTPFRGSFDGAGHRIYGLNVPVTDGIFVGLFGWVEGEGLIKNLTIANYRLEAHVDTLSESTFQPNLFMGAVAAYSNGVTFYNCHSRGGFVSNDTENNKVYAGSVVGGLIGRSTKGSILNCSNSTDLNLVSYGLGYSSGRYGGGIVGYGYNISQCINSGNITSREDVSTRNDIMFLGGLAGRASYIEKSSNTGNITSENGYAGGISARTESISSCQNYGNVSGKFAGGLSVEITRVVRKSLNEGDVYGSQKAGGISCEMRDHAAIGVVNGGAVSGDTVAGMFVKNTALVINSYARSRSLKGISCMAGFVVQNSREIFFSYFDSTLAPKVPFVVLDLSQNPSFGAGAMSTEDMKKAEFAYRLTNYSAKKWELYNENNVVNDVSWSFDGGYPFFSDEENLPVYKVMKDDGFEINDAYTDSKGHLTNLDPAYSEDGHYFVGWFDSAGTKVSASTKFAGEETVFAKYAENVEDSALVVIRPNDENAPIVMGWNGDFKVPEKKVRRDTSVYVVIRTPSELAWYTKIGVKQTPYAILGNDIVMGKDTLSVMDTTREIRERYSRLYKNYLFDGGNHTIYGLSQSIFTIVKGSVKNLHVANSLLVPGYGAIAEDNEGLIQNCTVRRPIIKAPESGFAFYSFFVDANSGVIEDCRNDFDIDIQASYGSGVKMSGAARSNYGTIKNFRNVGKMVVHGKSDGGVNPVFSSSQSTFAGVSLENSGRIQYCKNETSYDLINATGIVVGIARGGTITSSENAADFSAVLTTGDNYVRMFGIGENATIDSSVNTGSMTVSFGDLARTSAELFGIGSDSVKNSVNKGDLRIKVESDSVAMLRMFYVGGISKEGFVDSCVNYGNIEFSMKDSLQSSYEFAQYSYFGGIVASTDKTIRNSVNFGSVIGFASVGGIAGESKNGHVENVLNRGHVASYGVGDVLEPNFKTMKTYVGGVAGSCGKMENVRNEGPIEGAISTNVRNLLYVGGVCGENDSEAVKRAANVGPVTAQTEGNGIAYAAGVSAYAWRPIENSYNWGDIKSSGVAGGFMYSPFGISVENSYSASKVAGSIKGAFDGNDDIRNPHLENGFLYYHDGRVEPYQKDFTPTVYYDSSLVADTLHIAFGRDFSYKTIPMKTSEMQSDNFVMTLNTSAGTAENSGIWTREDGYPVFVADFIEDEVIQSSSSSIEESSSSKVESSSSQKVESSSSEAVESSSSEKAESSSSEDKLSLNTVVAAGFTTAVDGRQVMLFNAGQYGEYALMNSLGSRIAAGKINGNQTRIAVPQAGAYILRVGPFTKRIVVK